MDNVSYEVRLKNYNKVKNPVELLNFMNNYIEYGLYGTDGVRYTNYENSVNSDFQRAFQTKYALCNKDRVLKYGFGNCFDQVELERNWFLEHNYKIKTFFICFDLQEENDYAMHTYLVFENNNKFYYFEHADYINSGIYQFDSYKEAILFQINKHIEYAIACNLPINDDIISRIKVFEFDINKYEINFDEYLENVLNSKIIYENNKFID